MTIIDTLKAALVRWKFRRSERKRQIALAEFVEHLDRHAREDLPFAQERL
jgi:hypothetical protein